MKNTDQSFKQAYKKLRDKDGWKFSVELFHHDETSEPFCFSESYIKKLMFDYIGEYGFIVTIITEEISISFNEKNFLAHTDEDYVSFGSRQDNGTHCIIHFC